MAANVDADVEAIVENMVASISESGDAGDAVILKKVEEALEANDVPKTPALAKLIVSLCRSTGESSDSTVLKPVECKGPAVVAQKKEDKTRDDAESNSVGESFRRSRASPPKPKKKAKSKLSLSGLVKHVTCEDVITREVVEGPVPKVLESSSSTSDMFLLDDAGEDVEPDIGNIDGVTLKVNQTVTKNSMGKNISCFNCNGNHTASNCPEPTDHDKVASNYNKMAKKDQSRIHKPLTNFKPGEISRETADALGLQKDHYPCWILQMRKYGPIHGYPPAYLKQLISSDDVLPIYTENQQTEVKEQQNMEFDKEGIIYYSGFNKVNKSDLAEKKMNDFERYKPLGRKEYVKSLEAHAIEMSKSDFEFRFSKGDSEGEAFAAHSRNQFDGYRNGWITGEKMLQLVKDGEIKLNNKQLGEIKLQLKAKKHNISAEQFHKTQGVYQQYLDGEITGIDILDRDENNLIALDDEQRQHIKDSMKVEMRALASYADIEEQRDFYGVNDRDYEARRKPKKNRVSVGTQTNDNFVIEGPLLRRFQAFMESQHFTGCLAEADPICESETEVVELEDLIMHSAVYEPPPVAKDKEIAEAKPVENIVRRVESRTGKPINRRAEVDPVDCGDARGETGLVESINGHSKAGSTKGNSSRKSGTGSTGLNDIQNSISQWDDFPQKRPKKPKKRNQKKTNAHKLVVASNAKGNRN